MFWIPKPNKVPAATPAQGVVICDKNGTEKDNTFIVFSRDIIAGL
jgi:hypothetical protein